MLAGNRSSARRPATTRRSRTTDERDHTASAPGRGASPEPVQGNVQRDRHGHARPATRRSSASSTRGTSRCSSTRCAPTAWPRSSPSPTWSHSTGSPRGSWSAACSRSRCPQSSSIPGGTAVVTVQFQRFGTILTFLPEILPNDVIRLDVEPVISELNFAQGTTVNGGHGPLDHRAERANRRRAAGGPDAGDRRTAPVAHQRHHGPDPGPGRPADRRPLVQRQHASRRSRPRRSCS